MLLLLARACETLSGEQGVCAHPRRSRAAQDHGVPFNFEDLRLRQANGELSDECYEARPS